MKKFIAILLSVALLASTGVFMTAFAAETPQAEAEQGAGMLGALEIVDGDFNPEAALTKYTATVIAMRLIGKQESNYPYAGEFSDIDAEDPAGGLVLEAVKSGVANAASGAMFARNANVSYTAAVTLLFNALKYNIFSSVEDTSNYTRLANRYDLNKVPVQNRDKLTCGEFAKMAELVLEIPLITFVSAKNDSVIYGLDRDSSALNEYFDVYKVEGRVTANGVSGLYTKDGGRKNSLTVEGTEMKLPEGKKDAVPLLGHQAEVYYKNQDDPVYVRHNLLEEKRLLLESEDIQNYAGGTYSYENNGRLRQVKLAKNPAVIYNGVAVTDEDVGNLDDDLFQPKNGYVELLSESGSSYDVVKIYDYETYVVQNVMSDSGWKMLVDKYDQQNLVIPSEESYLSVKNAEGSEIAFAEIEVGDVLNVASSFEKEYVEIYACGDAVEGIYKAKKEDKITIEGEEFTLSPYLREHLNRLPGLGEYVTVYLDSFGYAAAVEMVTPGSWNLGLLLRTHQAQTGLSTSVKIRIVTQKDGMKDFETANRVYVDGVLYRNADNLLDNLPATNEVIRYQLNKDGMISGIDTALVEEADSSLHMLGSGSYTWRNTHSVLYNSNNEVVPVDSGATVFVNPEFVSFTTSSNVSASDFYPSDYFVAGVGFLTNGLAYNTKVYKVGTEGMTADVLVCGFYNYDLYMRTEATYVVNSIANSLNDDGEPIILLECTGISGVQQFWDYADRAPNFYTNSIATLKDVKPGDIVRADTASDGRVLFMFKIFDYKDRVFYQRIYSGNIATVAASGELPRYNDAARPGEYNNYPDREYYVYGEVLKLEDGYLVVRPIGSDGTPNENREVIFRASDNVVIYDKDNVRRGMQTDIAADLTGAESSKVLIAAYLGGIQSLFILR